MTCARIRLLSALLGVAAVLPLHGCATTYHIRPAAGGDVAESSDRGLTLLADGQAWTESPGDVYTYLTPIGVEISNRSDRDIRISYSDFALTNEQGFRFPAINPYASEIAGPPTDEATPARDATQREQTQPEPRAAPPPQEPVPPPQEPARAPHEAEDAPPAPGDSASTRRHGPLIAAIGWPLTGERTRSGSEGDGVEQRLVARRRSSVRQRRGVRQRPTVRHRRVAPRRSLRRRGRVVIRRGRGFYVYPRTRAYFHYYPAWGYAYAYGPYYRSHVFGWGRVWDAQPPAQIRRLGLPEGVIKPGGSVTGFLYFQNAHDRSDQLTLTWNAHTPDGTPLTTLETRFIVYVE